MVIKWERRGLVLEVARELLESDYSNPGLALREEDFVEIANWCDENHCGRRTAYHMFQFRNEKEMTVFLLRWS